MRTTIVVCAVVLLAGLCAGAVHAQDGADRLREALSAPGESDEPVFFRGDYYEWDRNTNVIDGYGSIYVEQGARQLEGDRIRLFLDREIAELQGNVAVSQEGQTVYGEAATYDLAAQQGTFDRPRAFVDPWYIEADDVQRESPTTYRANRARITTCGPGTRDWRLHVRDLTVDEERRRVRAENVVGYAGRVPIFYLPVFSQNIDRRRPPIQYDIGYQSDVGGFLRLGFPVDVTDDFEIQPRLEVYTESGPAGAVSADGTLFDNTTVRSDFWYLNDFSNDNLDDAGVTAERFKFDLFTRTELPDDWVLLGQLEHFSDNRVLETFFWDDFREREEPESFLDLTWTKPHTVLEFTGRKRFDDFTVTTDYLPRMQADLLEYRLFGTPVFVSFTSDTAYAELKPEDQHAEFSRHEARVSAPFRVGRYASVVPFVELDGQYHGESNFGSGADDYDGWVRPGVTLQNRYHAVFASPLKRYERMRHLIVPSVTYSFRDGDPPDPEDLAFFDMSQLTRDENRIEVELRHKLQGKRADGTIDTLVGYNTTLITELQDGTDHLAEIENELVVRPANRWVLSAQHLHNFRREVEASDLTTTLTYGDPLGITAHVGLVYTDAVRRPFNSQVTYGLALPLSNRWRVGFEHRLNTDDGELEQQEYWVWHAFDCWEVALSVRDRQESVSVMGQIGISAWPNPALDRYRDRRLIEGTAQATFSLFDDEVCKPCAEQDLTPREPAEWPDS